jgi:asparagine synthase (glutamine-hydrolysing)
MMEKAILRTAFAEDGILPKQVLWRRKEAFSDGISRAEKSWFQLAAAKGEAVVGSDSGSDSGFPGWKAKASSYVVNPPPTAEALWYRELFHQNYPISASAAVAPAMWMPRFVDAKDPSARTLSLYQA